VLRFSCAAVIDRDDSRAEAAFQKSHDLARRVAASTASAGWAARSVQDDVPHATEHAASAFGRDRHARRRSVREWALRDGGLAGWACASRFPTLERRTRSHSGEVGMNDSIWHTIGSMRWRPNDMGMCDDVSHTREHGAMALRSQERHKRRLHKGSPTSCASAAAKARCENCQNAHDLARRRRSAASAGWARACWCAMVVLFHIVIE